MSKEFVGREVVLKVSGSVIASTHTKGVDIGSTAIDISSDDSNGFRVLLDTRGERHLNLKLSGLAKDKTLLNVSLGVADPILNYSVAWPISSGATSGAVASGQCKLISYNESMEYKTATKFDAQVQSSGPIYFQPEA